MLKWFNTNYIWFTCFIIWFNVNKITYVKCFTFGYWTIFSWWWFCGLERKEVYRESQGVIDRPQTLFLLGLRLNWDAYFLFLENVFLKKYDIGNKLSIVWKQASFGIVCSLFWFCRTLGGSFFKVAKKLVSQIIFSSWPFSTIWKKTCGNFEWMRTVVFLTHGDLYSSSCSRANLKRCSSYEIW